MTIVHEVLNSDVGIAVCAAYTDYNYLVWLEYCCLRDTARMQVHSMTLYDSSF